MTKIKNRRAESNALGLVSRAETMLARASVHLLNGHSLDAMRLLRVAEQLNQLDNRLSMKRASEKRERAHNLTQRERTCEEQERVLAAWQLQIQAEHAELKKAEAELTALYQLMRNRDFDGPARATGEQPDSGVAPL